MGNELQLDFNRSSYDLFIVESTPVPSTLAFLPATVSSWMPVEYRLHGDLNQTFQLNSSTAELKLIRPIDYELIQLYRLIIEVFRRSTPSSSSFAELNIHLLNVNDNTPEINLIQHSSGTIKYNLQTCSMVFATIHLKDFDLSTKHLTLSINDSEHFQIDLLRETQFQFFVESIYILSTKNQCQWKMHHYSYGIELETCDEDSPNLCSTRSYSFRFQTAEYFCYLSLNQTSFLIDIQHNVSAKTLIFSLIKSEMCEGIRFSITDSIHFEFDDETGSLFTRTKFNRTERSIFIFDFILNRSVSIRMTVRLVDDRGRKPFLLEKSYRFSRQQFQEIHLFNSSSCRTRTMTEEFFQILSNCTIRSLIFPPPVGRFHLTIDLNRADGYCDDIHLELVEENPSGTIFFVLLIVIILLVIGLVFLNRYFLKKTELFNSISCATSQWNNSSNRKRIERGEFINFRNYQEPV